MEKVLTNNFFLSYTRVENFSQNILLTMNKLTRNPQMWYPCGSFKGDERSAALAQSFRDGGMLSGISKKQLDGGVANSLAQDESKLAETIARAYPQLRKSINEFEYGYKLAYDGLSEEQTTVNVIVPKKRDGGFLDGVKNLFD